MLDRREGWTDFLKSNFDKLLLSTLVCGFASLAYRGYHVGSSELAQFAVDNSKLFSGALLTLITGRLIAGNAQAQTAPTVPPPAPTPKISPIETVEMLHGDANETPKQP